MDINCPTCGEPWEAYHMRHDEPHEWGLSALELKDILDTGRFSGPNDRIREAARAAGWEFATDSVLSFTRCPCCVKATPLRDALARKERTTVLSELLDGDEDALASYLAE
ncbi:hypothetical protein ACT2FY_09285 [Paraburkholderia fungorum]|uniref:hypothetical protein n=1 Tax=Paraburkholderia fungorum TaxID=134537 RepID=UPI00402BCBAF